MSGVVFGLVSVVVIVAVVVALLASVYGLSIIMDRFCCCCPWFVPLGTGTTGDEANAAREVDNGPIARQAGLRGLRLDERISVVEAILVAQPYSSKSQPVLGTNDIENPKNKRPTTTKTEASAAEAATGHETSCSICLNNFEQGELILKGQNCSHSAMFRKSCLLEWLREHDHCPYCREEIIQPDSMKAMALVVLGSRRFHELTKPTNSSPAVEMVPQRTPTASTTTTTTITITTSTTSGGPATTSNVPVQVRTTTYRAGGGGGERI